MPGSIGISTILDCNKQLIIFSPAAFILLQSQRVFQSILIHTFLDKPRSRYFSSPLSMTPFYDRQINSNYCHRFHNENFIGRHPVLNIYSPLLPMPPLKAHSLYPKSDRG